MEPQGFLVADSSRITAYTYREKGAEAIPSVRLEGQVYGLALQRFIGVCVDIAIIKRARKEIYLARRRSKPLTGWWWLGGGQTTNQTKLEAAVANLKRETKLTIAPERFVYRASPDYFWKDRQQEPQTIGCHMLGHIYTVELTDEEIASIRLDPNEFEADKGLTPFTREMLVKENVFLAVIDLYDLVFAREQEVIVACGTLIHTVLISFYDDAPIGRQNQAYDLFQTLGQDCGGREAGILFWRVDRNLDLRKKVHLVEVAIFENNDALQKFRAHPKHVAIANIVREIADWKVGDINR